MNSNTKTRINVWAAFADRDTAALQRMSDAFEREFFRSQYDICVLNESWGDFSHLLRNASDDTDRITETMRKADYVLACLTPDLIEEDLVAQLRRAHAVGKEIIVFYYGRECDAQGKALSPRFSADIFLLLQGARQVALWGSPTQELEAIFSRKTPVLPAHLQRAPCGGDLTRGGGRTFGALLPRAGCIPRFQRSGSPSIRLLSTSGKVPNMIPNIGR